MPPPVSEQLNSTIETFTDRNRAGFWRRSCVSLEIWISLKRLCMRHSPLLWSPGPGRVFRKSPRPWLISTARFKAIDGMRRRARFDDAQRELAIYWKRVSTKLPYEAMIEEIHALNRELIAGRRQEIRLRHFPGRQREDGAEAARRQGARDRRTVHRDQGAHGRFLDSGSRRSMRHLHGRRRLPSPARCAAKCSSFFSTRTRREQRNSLARKEGQSNEKANLRN